MEKISILINRKFRPFICIEPFGRRVGDSPIPGKTNKCTARLIQRGLLFINFYFILFKNQALVRMLWMVLVLLRRLVMVMWWCDFCRHLLRLKRFAPANRHKKLPSWPFIAFANFIRNSSAALLWWTLTAHMRQHAMAWTTSRFQWHQKTIFESKPFYVNETDTFLFYCSNRNKFTIYQQNIPRRRRFSIHTAFKHLCPVCFSVVISKIQIEFRKWCIWRLLSNRLYYYWHPFDIWQFYDDTFRIAE